MRWTATLLAVPFIVLAVAAGDSGSASGPESSHDAPPGADGEVSTTATEVIDDRPESPVTVAAGRAALQHRLHRLEQQVRTGTTSPGGDAVPDPDAAIEVDPGPQETAEPAMVTTEGYEVVAGTARAGAGDRVAYTVEVDPRVDVDPLAVTAAVERALHDPRSWAADVELVRVEDPADARVRVVLATPAEVDRLCAEAGLNTAGRFSCWNGRVAALNAMRWAEGATDFDDLEAYRTYLVNHEFGHGLGYGHVDCPGAGQPAPVMMQQTMSTGGCVANGWPYPERSAD